VLYRDFCRRSLSPYCNSAVLLRRCSCSEQQSCGKHWLLSLADSYPFIAGVVGWVDLTDAGMEQELEVLTANPKFKGVRHLVESEPAEDWLVQPSVLRGLRALASYGVTYDLLVHTRHLKHARTIAEVVLNCSWLLTTWPKPPIKSGEIKEWEQEIKAVAVYTNVYCKLSGLVTETNLTAWRPEICGLSSSVRSSTLARVG